MCAAFARYATASPRRHYYEVIDADRPCWPYFDLEYARREGVNGAVNGDALSRSLVERAEALLRGLCASQHPQQQLEVEVVALDSHRPSKFSRHLLIKPHLLRPPIDPGGPPRRVPLPLRGSADAGRLAMLSAILMAAA